MKRTASTLLLAVSFLAALSAHAGKVRAVRHPLPAPPNTGPTFNRDIVRILQANCQSCHHAGDIAPFPLVTYDDAKSHASLIKFMTLTKKMPPWKPAGGCGEFDAERRLSTEEIATIGKWVDSGAPEGEASDLPAPLVFDSEWALGEPDLVLANDEPFTPPPHVDTYRCFTLPTNLIADKYVSAIDTHPGDRATVHHVISFIDTTGESVKLDEADPGPGYTCFGGPGFDLPGTLGGWAPGMRGLQLPKEVAFELPATSRVVLQVHYHPHNAQPAPDRTQFGIYFAKETPKNIMRVVPLVNQTFTIPPNNSNYEVTAKFPIATPFPTKIWFIAPHMHLLGRKMSVEMTPPNGASQCLINIDDWEFNWQGAYLYKNPIDVPAGTRLSLRAIYDNSSENPRNPNSPPRAVSWGEATTDEMCIAFLGMTVE
ncbi:MAG TPA: ascorbate-dependent monooxygenase [Thermoanaerobaculia bacterium]|nr:ascorbate-dependent monooxygenase [Thermoanaerobaculia bacterium]